MKRNKDGTFKPRKLGVGTLVSIYIPSVDCINPRKICRIRKEGKEKNEHLLTKFHVRPENRKNCDGHHRKDVHFFLFLLFH